MPLGHTLTNLFFGKFLLGIEKAVKFFLIQDKIFSKNGILLCVLKAHVSKILYDFTYLFKIFFFNNISYISLFILIEAKTKLATAIQTHPWPSNNPHQLSNDHRHWQLTPAMETIKITATKTQNQTKWLPSTLNSPILSLTTHTLATTTTTTTKYERPGLKKRRKRKDKGWGRVREQWQQKRKCGRFCQKALYYNVLFACKVSNTTLFIGPKINFFFEKLQLKMIANKINLED